MTIKELLVVLAPETSERGTEKHFLDLFRGPKWIYPPHYNIGECLVRPDENSVLLFEGGTDISSSFYGESTAPQTQKPDVKRDEFEKMYFEWALKAKAPMIGICRGAQLLCALNGGKIIQHVNGHATSNYRHKMQLPKCFHHEWIEVTSAHHQMMNPYNLPHSEWRSLGHVPHGQSGKYYGENGRKIKVHNLYTDFKEQEIIWFPKTKCLCIQGHPEYIADRGNPFVMYCRFLIKNLILGGSTIHDVFAN